MKALLMLVAMLAWAEPSGAQRYDVVPGPHAGKLEEVAGVQVELVVGDREVRLCVYDVGDVPQPVAGYSASVEIVSGARHETIALSPSDAVTLVGQGRGSLQPYSALTLHLTTPTGRSGSVSFAR